MNEPPVTNPHGRFLLYNREEGHLVLKNTLYRRHKNQYTFMKKYLYLYRKEEKAPFHAALCKSCRYFLKYAVGGSGGGCF